MPLPRSLANIKREISEKKWAETRWWAGGRTSKKKYKMPKSQRPNGTVAGSTKGLASRFYQLKTGHCRTGQYLRWAKARPTAQCWWCRCPTQTRDHLLKGSSKWKGQQRTLWKEVWEETGRGKHRWKAHELFADRRCSQAVLEILSSTDVGKIYSAGCGSQRRRRERGVGMGAPGAPGAGRGKEGGGAWCRGGAGGRGRNTAVPTHPALHGIGGWRVGGGGVMAFPLFFLL